MLSRTVEITNPETEEYIPVAWVKYVLSQETREAKCYCGMPVDTTNPDCVYFSLCEEHADDAEKQAKEILEDFYRLKSSGRYTPCMSKVDILVGEYED